MVVPQFSLDPRDLAAHVDAQLGVEIREGLVHQEHRRLAHDRPAHSHPLALAPRQRPGLAVEVLAQLQDLGGALDPLLHLRLGDLGQLQRVGDVLADGQVGVEGVVLEDHGNVALARVHLGHLVAAYAQHSLADLLQPGDHAKRRGLAAPRRPHEHHELAVLDREAHGVHRLDPSRVDLGQRLQFHGGHVISSFEGARVGASPSYCSRVSPALVRCAHGPLGPRPRPYGPNSRTHSLGLRSEVVRGQ